MYKLVALDLDGTLLNSNKAISSYTEMIIKKAVSKGVKIVLASARPYYRMEKYTRQLDIVSPDQCSISFNGGLVIINDKSERLLESGFGPQQVREIIELGRTLDTSISIYTETSLLTERIHEVFQNNKSSKDVNFNVVSFNDVDFYKTVVYKMVFVNFVERTPIIRKMIPKDFYERYEISSSVPEYVEFVPKGITKSHALECIGSRFGIDKSEMISVGDQENDLSMMNYVGLGVAMGNASESVKLQAGDITTTNDEDGVAKVIEKYFLK